MTNPFFGDIMTVFRDENKTVFEVEIKLSITEDHIENLLVTAFEGSINYWARIDTSTLLWKQKPSDIPISIWAAELILRGQAIKIYDVVDPDTSAYLTLNGIKNGLAKELQAHPENIEPENWDADFADNVIQFALWNDIIYC